MYERLLDKHYLHHLQIYSNIVDHVVIYGLSWMITYRVSIPQNSKYVFPMGTNMGGVQSTA